MRIPSTDKISPVQTQTISPTSNSQTDMLTRSPPLQQFTFLADAIALSFWNCCYLMQLFPAVTEMIITTAIKIEAPYIHPSAKPSVKIPKINETTAAQQRIWSISSSKFSKIFGYCKIYQFCDCLCRLDNWLIISVGFNSLLVILFVLHDTFLNIKK